uniref:Uncharacterized protein n=1 Tax=Solibacter usitatus (strain Ellin6076) TaxID=234267 RepID=Q02BZ0_SOLUE
MREVERSSLQSPDFHPLKGAQRHHRGSEEEFLAETAENAERTEQRRGGLGFLCDLCGLCEKASWRPASSVRFVARDLHRLIAS